MTPIAEAWQKRGRGPIRGKWVDRNKGDTQSPLVRSRYVACEVNTYKDESLFAATPPLEALRLLLSDAAARTQQSKPKKLLLIDVKKAHLHADAVREVYVSLPPGLAGGSAPAALWAAAVCSAASSSASACSRAAGACHR